jgi:lysozyme family protein
MADFRKAIEFVLKHEDPGLTGKVTSDSGGTTRWGIAQNSHPLIDVAKLTLEEAEAIYRVDYWRVIRGDEIANQAVASKLLDMAVNMGTGRAVKLCQRALGCPEDGRLGPMTLGLVNAARPESLIRLLGSVSEHYYRGLVEDRPQYHIYLNGWLKRAASLPPFEAPNSSAVSA